MVRWPTTRLGLILLGVSSVLQALPVPRGLVEDVSAPNQVLLVGVSHGLPGIDLDLKNVKGISQHTAFQFKASELTEAQGTKANVQAALTKAARDAGDGGTLFFYYSGHGSPGSIYLQDGSLAINLIRQAMEKGRQGMAPLERLVFISDSCFSGSLMDPLNISPMAQVRDPRVLSTLSAEALVEGLTGGTGRSNYWNKLFVFASSRADETSLAGSTGSVFTNALVKAFKEVEEADGTMEDFVVKTQDYTKGHHPVARFAPLALATEALVP